MEIIGLIGIGISLLVTGFNAAIFCVVKFNDLQHLTKKVDELKVSIDCLTKKMFTSAEKIAEIDGRCKANHS